MADYFNQMNLNIAEIVTFQFNHCMTVNGEQDCNIVSEVVTTFDNLITIHYFIGELIEKHKENLTMQKEANKKLS